MSSVTVGVLTFIYEDNLLGLTQEINVAASVDFLDGQTLINAIRQAESSTVGMSYPPIAIASGRAQLSEGVSVGVTIQLRENWKIYTLKTGGAFAIGGANIVKSDGSNLFVNNPSITYIQNLAVASTQVSSGSGGSSFTAADVWAVPYSGLTQTGTIGRLLYWVGKLFGATSTSVTASNSARITGDGTINQTITTNADGSKTMSGNP